MRGDKQKMKEINFSKKENIKVIAEIASYIDSLEDEKQYILTIKEKKNRRSLNANAYAWALMDKLAESTHITKTEIYKNYIKEIGGNSDIVCVMDNAVNKLCTSWQRNGLGWLTDTMPSKITGCTNVVLYYGSSTYDTKQMSRLIDMIVQDCKIQGIETLTPDELAQMMNEWEEVMEKKCFLCGRNGRGDRLEKHHIFGGAYRQKSDKYKLTVWLCGNRCHRDGEYSAHKNPKIALYLHQYGQRKVMETQGWDISRFIEEFGKNYIDCGEFPAKSAQNEEFES